MHFVKQFFRGCVEGWVHGFFTKYGRGVFKGPVLSVRCSGDSVKVSGTPDYCGVVGLALASCAGGVLEVSGSIYSKTDFRGALEGVVEFDDKTKKGFYAAEVKGAVDAGVLKRVYEAVPDGFVLLSVKGSKPWSLKCGGKLPKPGGEAKEEFFSAGLGGSALKMLLEEVLFDVEAGFREARVEHKYFIDEIAVPPGVKDAAEARLKARRRGRVERRVVVDGVEKVSTCVLDA